MQEIFQSFSAVPVKYTSGKKMGAVFFEGGGVATKSKLLDYHIRENW